MKEYRLIKTYPNSAPKGSIFKQYYNGAINYFYSSEELEFGVSEYHINKFSEYWEEIKKLDYEILKYNGAWFNYSINFSQKEEILTVKRLSDNEIFSIKDNTNNGIIKMFEEYGNMIRVYFERKGNYHVNLNTLKHIKKPLFTTEDGVDKYLEDMCYYVTPSYTLGYGKITIAAFGYVLGRFNIKNTAQEYIDNNKPQYSQTDLIDFGLNCWGSTKNKVDYIYNIWKKYH